MYESEKKLDRAERSSQMMTGLSKIGTSLYAGVTDKKALKKAYKYNAAVTNYNNAKLERAAAETITAGGVEQNDINLRARLDQAQGRADAVARGVDPNSGSAADITIGAMNAQAVDIARTQDNVYRAARQQYDEIYAANIQQKMDHALMKEKLKANKTEMFSSMMSGVSTIGGAMSGGGGFFSTLFGS
jgi:hypothetical protein